MNVSTPLRNVILYLVLCLIPAVVSSQIEYHEVLVNDSLHYNFESAGNAAQIEVPPSNGDYIFNGLTNYPLGSSGNNELIYVPYIDFLGTDTIEVLYYIDELTGPVQSYKTLVINVVESYVTAVNDYAVTDINTSIMLDVLANDIGTGTLIISDVPLVNYGLAEIVNGSIEFTPIDVFKGITNLTYTVCDQNLTTVCDVATITVFVKDNVASVDTTTLVTLKNQKIKPLFSTVDGIQELLGPKYGSVSLVDGGVEYLPNNDFVGKDTFTYAYDININTSVATFIIDVLYEDDPNTFVVNDRAYSAINDSTAFNVLTNDLNGSLSILNHSSSDKGGQVIHNGNGDFKYIPPTGFAGLDFFDYTAVVAGTSAEETGTVYLTVSNQKPSSEFFDIYTVKNTPLVVDYAVPIGNYDFEITNQSQFGQVIYYPGDTSIQVNGQEVSGYNLIIYYPYDSYVGDDQFDLEYCVGTDCKSVEVGVSIQDITNPQADTLCVANCTWPGDTNKDGKVSMTDILPLGYCVGEVGPERTNASEEWYGQFGSDWNGNIGDTGVNIKHVDANGDGYISDQDTALVSASYGKFNTITSEVTPIETQTPLFFVPRTPNAGPGDKVIIDIVLGLEGLPATDVHGITFALNFNQDIVEPGTMNVLYTSDNWMSHESAMLSMMKEPTLGRVESGYTRATGISNHGYGVIGQVSFIVVDDIVDGVRLRDTLNSTFRPESLIAMNAAGEYMQLNSQNFDIRIAHDIADTFTDNRLLVTYPNPTTGELNIHVNGNNELEQIIVHSITGQEVYRTHDALSGKQTNITFNDRMANGIYLVTAICDKGVYTKKVELVR